MKEIIIDYWWEMPNKYTFRQPKVLRFVSRFIPKFSIPKTNPPKPSLNLIAFAGVFRFGTIDNSTFIYNDSNTTIKADYHLDAHLLKDHFPKYHFDSIIADPPFSMFQFYKNYSEAKKKGELDDFKIGINRWRETAEYLLKPNGIYIELGYNSTGLPMQIAEKIALGICCCGSTHNDILILVQKKLDSNPDLINQDDLTKYLI